MKMKAKKRIIHAFRHQVHTDASPLLTAASVFVSKADKVKAVAMQIVGIESFSELQKPPIVYICELPCQFRTPYADKISYRGEHSNILDYQLLHKLSRGQHESIGQQNRMREFMIIMMFRFARCSNPHLPHPFPPVALVGLWTV